MRLYESLNVSNVSHRLENLKKLLSGVPVPVGTDSLNLHVHTKYSFSPYSPTHAVFSAYESGLDMVGIVDHDSFAGVDEFIEAGRIAGIKTSLGFELRVDYSQTPFEGRIINNPDQKSVAYMLFHGVPYAAHDKLKALSKRIIGKRMVRNTKMCENISYLLKGSGTDFDFERDVLPHSWYLDGGTVTERHILYGLVERLYTKCEGFSSVCDFIAENLGIDVAPDCTGGEYAEKMYILGKLKAEFVERFYVDATDELIPVKEAVAFAHGIGAIPCYSYLGDVTRNVTGDKKFRSFEDSYLEELIGYVADGLGIDAVTYALTRNTDAQIERLRKLCKEHNLFELCGDDINTISQDFVSPALKNPKYAYLLENAAKVYAREQGA
ncbi:MAG: PHP domain-containing protein [Christensenellales bacterium]